MRFVVVKNIIPLFTPFSCEQGDLRREKRNPLCSQESEDKELKEFKSVADLIAGYETPHDGWESYQVKDLIKTEYEKWIFGLADWKSLITLTFRDEKTPDVANSLFKWFVRKNNEHAFGTHYTEKVKHSYFSYVLGLEYQTRDVVHFHVLVDKPLDFTFVHRVWGKRCGYAWIDGDIRSKARAVNYVCKYCVKGGQIDVYLAERDVKPEILPAWWRSCETLPSRVVQGPLMGFCGPEPLAKPLTVNA
jgi:hypothetical protein